MIQPLQKSILTRKAARARGRAASEKLADGARLYDLSRAVLIHSIIGQHPDWSEMQVREELKRRRNATRQVHEKEIYVNVSTDEFA
ncbi:hypothetical protein [Rubripirellula obstinata]|uniref:hypothetical protein n=1 Tax=Rubripirellula obstinata TaxID=406547 RepID=UPI00083048BD|nr:hypothetical protein [Rubripirellula obstinata]